MPQHTSTCLPDLPSSPHLVSSTRNQAAPIRWSRVLDARDAIRDGVYDDSSLIAPKLEDCVEAMVADLAARPV